MMAYLTDWHGQNTLVMGLCIFFFCSQWVMPRFGLSASLLLATCAYSAIWAYVWKDNRYLPIDPYNQMALRYFACDSLAKIMVILVPMMLLAEKSRATMLLLGEIFCSLFVVVNSSVAIWQSRNGCTGLTCGGIIGNPSISMGLMACTLPIFLRSWKRQWPIMAMASAAILFSKSSVAAGLLAAYSFLHFLPSIEKSLKWLAVPVAATAGVFGIAHYTVGNELLNDSNRFAAWAFMFERWRAPWNIPTGTGLGTYHVFSINLQQMHGGFANPMWWNTMHNDYLQMLFECGAVGLLFFIATYCVALLKTFKEKNFPVLMSVVLYGIYMALDPALHNPLPVLFGAWLFVYALRRENPLKEYV